VLHAFVVKNSRRRCRTKDQWRHTEAAIAKIP